MGICRGSKCVPRVRRFPPLDETDVALCKRALSRTARFACETVVFGLACERTWKPYAAYYAEVAVDLTHDTRARPARPASLTTRGSIASQQIFRASTTSFATLDIYRRVVLSFFSLFLYIQAVIAASLVLLQNIRRSSALPSFDFQRSHPYVAIVSPLFPQAFGFLQL